MKNKKCVLNYAEGRDAWNSTFIATILSKKGIWSATLLSIATMGSTPFWWPSAFKIETVEFSYVIFGLLFLFSCSISIGLIYLRYRTLRSLDIKYLLHQLVHDIRDYHTKKFRDLKDYHTKKHVDFNQEYREHLLLLANHAREHFKRLTNDNSIEIAIRLAYPSMKEKGNIVYITRVRTSGLNKNRETTSEPILANQGIPRYLIEKGCQEILIYLDINEAIELCLFKKTKSEEKYPNEIKTMIVCPLNAWDGSRKSMIGILYITSRKGNVFSEKHVDSARFIADTLANSISFSTMLHKMITKRKLKEVL